MLPNSSQSTLEGNPRITDPANDHCPQDASNAPDKADRKMNDKNSLCIVIIGAGLAGTATLRNLQRLFRGQKVQFLVIEKNQDFVFHDVATRSLVDGADFAQCAIWKYEDRYINHGRRGHLQITATVMELHASHLVLHDGNRIEFDYCVVATGSLASPANPFVPISIKSKTQALDYYNQTAQRIKQAESIVLVGGGPSSCELAAEMKCQYPNKSVTLIHSRTTLLSGDTILEYTKKRLESKLKSIGVDIILNEKVLDIPSDVPYQSGIHCIKTNNGLEIKSDLTFYCISKPCPSTRFLLATYPHCLDQYGFIPVKPTLQVDDPDLERIFALGDVAATGAPKMTRVIRSQAFIAAKNIYIHYGNKDQMMIDYNPPKDDLIGIPLGRIRGVVQLPFIPSWIAPVVMPFIDISIGFIKNNSFYTSLFSKLFGFT